jgi:hypothetical protein
MDSTPERVKTLCRRFTFGCMLVGTAIAATAAEDFMPRPGSYEMTTTSNFGELPVTQTSTTCITAEQLARDPREVFAEVPASEDCDMTHYEMAHGNLNVTMVCADTDGTVTIETRGAYTLESYTLTTRIIIDAGDSEVVTEARVNAIRTGDC